MRGTTRKPKTKTAKSQAAKSANNSPNAAATQSHQTAERDAANHPINRPNQANSAIGTRAVESNRQPEMGDQSIISIGPTDYFTHLPADLKRVLLFQKI